jgi:hypothetical protein
MHANCCTVISAQLRVARYPGHEVRPRHAKHRQLLAGVISHGGTTVALLLRDRPHLAGSRFCGFPRHTASTSRRAGRGIFLCHSSPRTTTGLGSWTGYRNPNRGNYLQHPDRLAGRRTDWNRCRFQRPLRVILRCVFWHSIALASLVGGLVMLQAYVPPFTEMVVVP